MGIVIDTCVFIKLEKGGKQHDFSIFEKHGGAFISALTVSELLLGVHRADTDIRRIKRSAFVETIISSLPILDFTMETARTHAEIVSYLLKKGEIIGAHDLLIAATALQNGHAVLTHNTREFSRVPGLELCVF